MAHVKTVLMSEIHAAHSFSPHDFIDEPCGTLGCDHGKGQHIKPRQKGATYWPTKADRGQGPCTAPGCKCPGYLDRREIITGLA